METYPKEAGIYKLTCSNNGKVYIGKSVNLYERLGDHRRCANKIKGDVYFENAIIKYGWDSFIVEILEIIPNFDKTDPEHRKSILDIETSYIKLFDSSNKDKGYNICEYSNDRTGQKHSEETKSKMSKSRLGKTHSEKSKEKMSRSQTGRIITEDHREKIRQGNLGKSLSEETKEKMRKPKSETHKEKMRKPKSEETKEKLRQAFLGKPRSEETKEKIRKSHERRRLLKQSNT